MCFFYRELMKCLSPKIREWDLSEGHRYDSAMAGSSSLRAAVIRALKIENATAIGMHIGHLLWEMEKFYDSIDLLILAGELIERSCPVEFLILGILAHAASRILKMGIPKGGNLVERMFLSKLCKLHLISRTQYSFFM